MKQHAKRLILWCGLSVFACGLCAQGAEVRDAQRQFPPGDSLRLHFRTSSARVDSGYKDNRLTLRQLERLLADSTLAVHIDSLHIHSYASPDGSMLHNGKLARQRSEASRKYLLGKYPYLDPLRICTTPQVGSWERLLYAVEQDLQVPARKRVMAILSSSASEATKQANLRLIAGGAAYRYLSRHYLPLWRNATVGMVWMPEYGRLAQRKAEATELPDMREAQTPASPLLLSLSLSSADFKSAETEYKDFQSVSYPYIYKVKRPLLALKTNLLFDLALMPNLEVEVPIRERWSLNGELMFPWWLFDKHKYCFQILMGGLEGRYWLGSRKYRENHEVLTGHFLGLYAGGGKYDLQWDRNGYQGEFFIAAGISYGYAHKIARNLRLEYNIGIGLLRTDYEYYHPLDNHRTLLWQNNGRYTWFGPTKAKISLVWMLNRKVKKGGVK